MAVDSAISSIANSSSSYSATSKGKTSGSDLDKEAFLNLLVTQMQYQDPLNPSDNTEYMSQLAQYSALEAQLNISDTLDKGNKLNLVGKYVIMNTTDSSGKQAMISGLVEYATVKDGCPSRLPSYAPRRFPPAPQAFSPQQHPHLLL